MNWKKIAYAIVMGSLVIGGLVVVLYYGLQPRPVPKINLSQFSHAPEAGQAIGKRLWLELKDAPVLVIGVWPNRPEEIEAVTGLLNALIEPDLKYDVVVVEPGLPGIEAFAAAQPINFRDEMARFAEGVKAARAQGKRIVAIVPSIYASKLVTEGPSERLFKEFGIEFTSISFAPFPVSREQEEGFEVQCNTGNDSSGTSALGCAILQKARILYRKKKDPAKFTGVMDLVGAGDYLFMLAPPVAK